MTDAELVERARRTEGPASARISALYTAALEGYRLRTGFEPGEHVGQKAFEWAVMAYLDERNALGSK